MNVIYELPVALVAWYTFRKNSRILLINGLCSKIDNSNDSIFDYLKTDGHFVCNGHIEYDGKITIEKEEFDEVSFFDYIVVVKNIDISADICVWVNRLYNLLSSGGILLLAMNNPFGLRYFCGDKDEETDEILGCIDKEIVERDNKSIKDMMGMNDISLLLRKEGFGDVTQYSVFPSLGHPQIIYREDTIPDENIATRINPEYCSPDTIFMDEYTLLDKLTNIGIFHQLSNTYLFVCSCSSKCTVRQSTINITRGTKYSMCTNVLDNDKVIKKPVYEEGIQTLFELRDNHNYLLARGIPVVNVQIEGGIAQSKYLNGINGVIYFKRLISCVSDSDFIKKVDSIKDIIMESSENIIDEQSGEILLEKGFIDLTLINCIFCDDKPIFFDQEYCIPNLPVKVLLHRLIEYLYFQNLELESRIPRVFFEQRYDILKKKDKWSTILYDFMYSLKNENEMAPYYEKHCTNSNIITSNRRRMNHSVAEYDLLFNQVFDGITNKKIYIFGSGIYAQRFLKLYGRFCEFEGIIDNNSDIWNTQLLGINIFSPTVLVDEDPLDYKVIICIKNYSEVLHQLKKIGTKNIAIYDPNKIYNIRQDFALKTMRVTDGGISPKYNIGYIAGVFDLFHIGHLNLLRRAKEQCNHLIVGIVNDEVVKKNKRVDPFIPFEERIEMVRACKYVDETVEVTYSNAGTRDAFRLYHFDVQFSGSDYSSNGDWLAEKLFLEKNGSTLVFLSYTEGTSSTKIKKLIEKKLL